MTVTIESTSTGGVEELILQNANARSGEWVDFAVVERRALTGDWQQATFQGTLLAPLEGDEQERLAVILEENRPEVEITDVTMTIDGEEALSVVEEQPFTIGVHVRANQPVPVADVWLKLVRSDGFYTFWIRAGRAAGDLRELAGARIVRFHFDPNIFGAGDYEVEAVVANGFDLEHDWPHTRLRSAGQPPHVYGRPPLEARHVRPGQLPVPCRRRR